MFQCSNYFHQGGRVAIQFIPCYNTSHDLILLCTEYAMEHTVATTLSQINMQYMSWKDWKRLQYHYQYIGLMQIGTKTDLLVLGAPYSYSSHMSQCTDWPRNCCNCTVHPTLTKAFSMYVLLHIETYMESHIPTTLMLFGIFTQMKIS